jgi:hypothetical protein
MEAYTHPDSSFDGSFLDSSFFDCITSSQAMTFKEGLIAARSRIVMILGLLTTAAIIVGLERSKLALQQAQNQHHSASSRLQRQNILFTRTAAAEELPAPIALNDEERRWAQIAWKYFENNYQPSTGLVNSVDNYTASTMWDTGSYLLAILSAHKLGVISTSLCNERLSAALKALATLPLFANELPNKSYNTLTKAMVDYNNQPTERGIGWSVIDVGRLFVPLHIIVWEYPQFTAEVRTILNRFNFRNAVNNGVLYGALLSSEPTTAPKAFSAQDSTVSATNAFTIIHPQEGRLGYEEYAAKSFQLMGKDVSVALRYDDFLRFVQIGSVEIPTDSRTPDRYKAFNYVVSESYILDGLEFGFDDISREFAYRVYKAQEERYNTTKILTAVSEDNIDVAPYFVYNTVYTAGKTWNCITDKGEDASAFRSVSTKAAFGWYALYRTQYTRTVLDAVKNLYNPERGWYSGLYEKTGKPNTAITANTNAIILEALCYKQYGRLINLIR